VVTAPAKAADFALTLACALACGLALACTSPTAFVCSESSDCTDGSFSGMCQANGYCSFGDDTCASGQRYGDLAPNDLAGTCVESEGTTTAPVGTTDDGAQTTLETLDGASLEQGTLEGSTLDGTTTGGESTTSSGGPVLDESSTQPDSMTAPDSMTTEDSLTSSDTDDSSDTMPGGCGGMMGKDECSACAYEACCQEILECSTEMACTCAFNCAVMGIPEDQCAEMCGDSQAVEPLNACLLANCGMACPVP